MSKHKSGVFEEYCFDLFLKNIFSEDNDNLLKNTKDCPDECRDFYKKFFHAKTKQAPEKVFSDIVRTVTIAEKMRKECSDDELRYNNLLALKYLMRLLILSQKAFNLYKERENREKIITYSDGSVTKKEVQYYFSAQHAIQISTRDILFDLGTLRAGIYNILIRYPIDHVDTYAHVLACKCKTRLDENERFFIPYENRKFRNEIELFCNKKIYEYWSIQKNPLVTIENFSNISDDALGNASYELEAKRRNIPAKQYYMKKEIPSLRSVLPDICPLTKVLIRFIYSYLFKHFQLTKTSAAKYAIKLVSLHLRTSCKVEYTSIDDFIERGYDETIEASWDRIVKINATPDRIILHFTFDDILHFFSVFPPEKSR